MTTRSRRSLVVSIALITCIATVTSVTWLSNTIAAQHASVSGGRTTHGRHQLLTGAVKEGVRVEVSESQDMTQRSRQRPSSRTKRARVEPQIVHELNPHHTNSSSVALHRTDNQKPPEECRPIPNTDYWGDALEWGSSHRKETWGECCEACMNYKPLKDDQPSCNVWVYCGDEQRCGEHYKECWIKHLLHPEGSSPKQGPGIPWMSGVFGLPPPIDYEALTRDTGEDRSFHVVITAQGSATHWQSRVHYYWYKKIQKECRAKGVCHMGGWTRLLHSGEPDDLMDELPTHVVKPLQDKDNKGYLVLNRPWAFVQWLREATISEKYILMSEPDHIWLKPMPNLMIGNKPAAFPFFYIEPAKADYVHITEKFTGKLTRQQIESISPIGNAPTLLSTLDLRKVSETWMNVSHAIFDDAEAHKAWGWVLEMYGFTISCFKVGIPPASLHLKMMAQPPWDNDLPFGPSFFLLHYTYGMDYTLEGKFMPGKKGEWRFDKRSYGYLPPPRKLGEPPPGMENTLVKHLILAINEATEAIPGWDEYAKTGKATKSWDGKI